MSERLGFSILRAGLRPARKLKSVAMKISKSSSSSVNTWGLGWGGVGTGGDGLGSTWGDPKMRWSSTGSNKLVGVTGAGGGLPNAMLSLSDSSLSTLYRFSVMGVTKRWDCGGRRFVARDDQDYWCWSYTSIGRLRSLRSKTETTGVGI